MTATTQALESLMEEKGYSYGCIMTTIQILTNSKSAQDQVIDYLYDNSPTEKQFIAYLAEICAPSE